MTKNELARELADELELPRKQVLELIETLFEKVTAVLKTGDKVQLAPFGLFRVRDRAARIARNPMTGEPVKVPAKRVLKFTPSKALKETVMSKRGAAAPAKKKAAPAKKAVAKKAPAKKAAAKKAPARKAAAKKAPARKGRR